MGANGRAEILRHRVGFVPTGRRSLLESRCRRFRHRQGYRPMTRTTVRIFFNFRSPYCYLASHTLFPAAGGVRRGYSVALTGGLGWTLGAGSRQDKSAAHAPGRRALVPAHAGALQSTADLDRSDARRAGGFRRRGCRPVAPLRTARDVARMGGRPGHRPHRGAGRRRHRYRPANQSQSPALSTTSPCSRDSQENWQEASALGVIGVPCFVVGDQVFWGNDRIDFLEEHLTELGLRKR